MNARTFLLPQPFEAWFASRGWRPRAHQLELVRRGQAGLSTLLIAPTGAGMQIQIGKEGDAEPGTVRHLIGELVLLPIEGALHLRGEASSGTLS